MVSWAVTGATRGIGSANPNNQVFAIIRSRGTAGPLEELAAKRGNIHIIVTDISDTRKLNEAATQVSEITGGSLDVLILNAGAAGPDTSVLPPTALYIKLNLISPIYVINTFLELVRKGTEKKIVFISSQSADLEFTRITGFSTLLGYSVAKAGMNMAITKFAAELAPEGIKTLSLAPGWVNTDAAKAVTGDPEVRKFVLGMFHKVDPNVTGPLPVDESVTAQLQVIQSLSEATSGKFLSLRGTTDDYF
ncbi:NAD(P)-binding protein [Lophiostoma macrostomum CBS 122681]|uniref:NAD(P)-binding protein n=1 Tax=Lophiostoma macrostomum CBS 122681 TaxID=1314788 RepID=A0A6A6SIH0_9PLEO|nr:NAD(P)-binding protein [Lophiostoma macrostomum CBS 122681]